MRFVGHIRHTMAAIHLPTPSVKTISLKGIFPAITTPFNDKQEIFYEKLYENLQHYEKLPFAGYVLNGSNGEVSAVSIEERLQLVQKARQWIDSQKILIANAYCESTKQCCELTKSLAEKGADAVLVMVPFYHHRQLSEEAIVSHFRVVADASPVPVVVYNNPGVTHINISVSSLLKLAEHPNIRGVKEGDIGRIAEMLVEVRNKGMEFEVAQASAGLLLPALTVGATGGIVSLANIVGQQVCQVYQLYTENRLSEAVDLQLRLSRTDKMLSLGVLGVPGMKAALDLIGLYGGPCRLPLQPLPPQDLKRLRDQLVEDNLL